jgi:hypothetical protein
MIGRLLLSCLNLSSYIHSLGMASFPRVTFSEIDGYLEQQKSESCLRPHA